MIKELLLKLTGGYRRHPRIEIKEKDIPGALRGNRQAPWANAILFILDEHHDTCMTNAKNPDLSDTETKWWLGQASALEDFHDDLEFRLKSVDN
jgi:hypothetical protein